MKPPFSLVPDTVSTDTVECLQLLLKRARRGEVIGIAFCAMLKQRSYIVNTAGAAHASPTFARGMVAALDDSLSNRIHHKGETQ
jgi:hypothetical protein